MEQYMLQRVVIVSGGKLGKWSLPHAREADFLIGADSGAKFLLDNGLTPNIAIGDFDSVSHSDMTAIRKRSVKTITCDPIDKNYTDTEMAFRLALDMMPAELVVIGALGTRFDHSLANVHLLSLADKQGVAAQIIDKHNIIQLISKTTELKRIDHPHISLLPLTEQVTGITLHGFQYPLHEAELSIGHSLGISNVLLAAQGKIDLRSGKLLVIRSRD